MSNAEEWARKVAGVDCPFDHPRKGIEKSLLKIGRLKVSTAYLERIQTYRGHCVLVFDPRHVTRIDELTHTEWRDLADDIASVERALMAEFTPDHINIASLGQVVAHLHWHIIPRYVDDPRWGGPIWMTGSEEMPQKFLEDREYESRVAAIAAKL